MPHTNRKKKSNQRPKRTEMTDEQGWTHITSTFPTRPYKDLPFDDGRNWNDRALRWKRNIEEAPPQVTLPKLLGQYKTCETRFKESACWEQFAKDLRERALHDELEVDNCVCFGLGSPSAPSYQLDRRHVSMYQLAAFKAIIDLLQLHQPNQPVTVFAQDPIFNTIDKELLAALSVTVLENPVGFLHLTTKSFAFAPGHEQYVLKRILRYDPALLFGHDLEPYMGRDGRWREPSLGTTIGVLPDSGDEEPAPQDSNGESQDSRWLYRYKQANPPLNEDIAYKKPQRARAYKEDGKQVVNVNGQRVYVEGERVEHVASETGPPRPESPVSDGFDMVDAKWSSPSDSGSILVPGQKEIQPQAERKKSLLTESESAELEKWIITPEEALVELEPAPQRARRSDLHDADLVVSYLMDKRAFKMAPFEAHDHVFHENSMWYRLPKGALERGA